MIRNPVRTHWRRKLALLSGLVIVLLVLAACGSSSPEPTAAAPAATEAPTQVVEPTAVPTEAEPTAEPTEAVVEEPAPTEAAEEPAPTEAAAEEPAPTEAVAEEGAVDAGPDPVLEDSDAPPVALASVEAQAPSGRVIAVAGVNVRTGPGTNYDVIGVAPLDTEGEIIGVSEDGAWWVARVPSAPNEQGWVAAAYVEATNADNVPVIPTPPLPAAALPQMTPVPVPDALDANSLIVFSGSRVLRDGNRAYDLEDLYTVAPVPGSTAQLVIQNAMQPSLQPGGQILAFRSTQSDQLGLGGYDFNVDQRVRYSVNVEDSTPRWNPSGDQLVFSSNRTGDRRWRVYTTMAVPGDDRAGFSELVDLGFGKDADWHPSQNIIVFKGCDDTGNNCGLWTMNSDGSARAALTDSANDSLPRWSRDGASIVFMSDSRDGNWELYTLSVADGAVTRLTENPAEDGLPAWSPDGSRIAFMSNRDGAWGIWTVAASGGEAQLITQLEQQLPDWLLQGIDWPR